MAGFEILAVLGLLGLLALSSMACLPRSDDDLPLVDNRARLDALLAIGIASLEQMQRIQDDTWQGASTDSDDEIDDSVLANLQLPTSTDSMTYRFPVHCPGISFHAFERDAQPCISAYSACGAQAILFSCLDNNVDPVERTTCAVGCTRSDTS